MPKGAAIHEMLFLECVNQPVGKFESDTPLRCLCGTGAKSIRSYLDSPENGLGYGELNASLHFYLKIFSLSGREITKSGWASGGK